MTVDSIDRSASDAPLDDPKLAQILKLPFWTQAQAQHVLAAQARSGLSILRFAALHRTSPSRLYHWRKRIAAVPSPTQTQLPPPFVPVQVCWPPAAQPAHSPVPDDSPCWLWVGLPGGVQLRVFSGAPEPWVRGVLSALAQSPC